MLNNGSSQFQYSYQKKKPKHLEIVSSINTINIPPRNEAVSCCLVFTFSTILYVTIICNVGEGSPAMALLRVNNYFCW